MSQRLTNILGYLTLFAILGAVWVLFGEDPSRDQGGRGEPTFDGMTDRINDTSVLKLTGGDATVTLVRTDGGWALHERSGFAADQDKVLVFLRGIARSERREPKTANPERFDQIGLGDAATTVLLRDKDDAPILTFEIGERSAVNADRSLTYIFQESDTRSWLVTALAEASTDPAWWLDGTLLDLNGERIRRVNMGGATLARGLGEADFALVGAGEGETPVAGWQLSEPARLIARLGYADVRQLGNPLTDPVQTVEVQTHDGLTLTLALYDMEGARWAQLVAAYDPQAADAGAAGELPAAPEDGAAEAAAINAKARGWFFKLADYDAQVLMRQRSDFLDTNEVG